MKFRNGFVSNSSSSSFIVAHHPDIDEIILDSKDFTYEEYYKFFTYPSEYTKMTPEEFVQAVKGIGKPIHINLMDHMWEEDDLSINSKSPNQLIFNLAEFAKWIDIDSAIKAIEKGYIFRQGGIGYSGEATKGSEFLCRIGFINPPEGVIVVQQPNR